jgi:parvulin-like peptidyl-prolyl isomerase
LGIALLAASRAATAATELAKVGTTSISLEDFNKKYKENLKFFQFKAPTKKDVLEDIIKRELGIQEAKKAGLDKDPDVIDRMNTVLYHALLDKKLSKEFDGIHVTDGEAKEYYAKYPEIRTSHIFVACRADLPPDEQKACYEKIKKINDESLRDGKMGFAEAAQRFSESAAAPMGGDIDYQTKDKLDPLYYDTALKLKTPGKISSIFRTEAGYYIVKLTAVRPWEEADKAQIKRIVFDERRTQIYDKYMTTLRKQAKVTVNSELIKD